MSNIINSAVGEPCLNSSLVSNGNIEDAMLFLDRVDAGLNTTDDEHVFDALRYWMGEVFAARNYKQAAKDT